MKIRKAIIKFAIFLFMIVSPFAVAETFMSEKEMLDTFSGITLSGKSKYADMRWTQVYEEFKQGKTVGVIKGDFGGKPYEAQWFIRKGKWCENWGTGNGCYDLVRVDEHTIRAYEKGAPLVNLWEIKKDG